jgi:NADPH:quinone reductase-like Zn-dependent oxidoreductase
MLLEKPGFPLQLVDREKPVPAEQEILVRVAVCGVCRTDLHVLDGELEQTEYPIIRPKRPDMTASGEIPHKVSRNKSGTPIVGASKLFAGRPKRTTREAVFDTEKQARIFADALNLAAVR